MKIDASLADKPMLGNVAIPVLGDIVRQTGGVNLINIEPGVPLSTYLGNKISSTTMRMEKVSDSGAVLVGNNNIRWIDGKDPHAPLLTVNPRLDIEHYSETTKTHPFDLESIAQLHHAVRTQVKHYLTQEVKTTLAPQTESKIAKLAAAELPKIMALEEALENINLPDAIRSQRTLTTISSLITEHLSPGLETQVDSSHLEKAGRVLKSQRAIRLFHAITKERGSELAAQLELETIELASEVNHSLLVEKLETYLQENWPGVSLVEIKSNITNQIIPELSQKEYQDPEKLTKIIKEKLLPEIQPIVRYIVDKYEHETHAYLLGPNLINQKANCSGKAMMLSLLLQDVGLDARTAMCTVARYEEAFGHVYNHVYLPNHGLLEIDGNQSTELDQANLLFHCNVAILAEKNPQRKIPLTEYPTWFELAAAHDKTYITNNDELSVYHRTWGSETHKVSSDENGKLPALDTLSIKIDLESQTDLTRLQRLNYALSLFSLESRKSTNAPHMKYTVANELSFYAMRAGLLDQERKQYYLKQGEQLYRQSIQEMPYSIKIQDSLLENLKHQLAENTDQSIQKDLLTETVKIRRNILHLHRTLPNSMVDQRTSFYLHTLFMIDTILSEKYQALVLNNAPLAIRNSIKESILLLENAPTHNEGDAADKAKNLLYLYDRLNKMKKNT
jgi:hypothetical protein